MVLWKYYLGTDIKILKILDNENQLAVNVFIKDDDDQFMDKDYVPMTRWKDRRKKPVTVVSNMHNGSSTENVLRTNSSGEKTSIHCPSSIADYNRHMGAVDRFDQYLSAYSVAQKSRRWWLKLFYYLLDSSIVNAFILYKESCDSVKKKIH